MIILSPCRYCWRKLAGFLLLLLAGCASSPEIPEAVREAPQSSVSVAQVQRDPESTTGKRTRWGGSIIAVRNRKQTTEIEILSRPLGSEGRPMGDQPGEGRFIAELKGFADGIQYPKMRLLTVSGRLSGIQTRPIGEYAYQYPVVSVDSLYLWPKRSATRPDRYLVDPWHSWYDPWYDPWYPHYRLHRRYPWTPGFYPWYQ